MTDLTDVLHRHAAALDLSTPASDAELRALEEAVGRPLPLELAAFYRAGGLDSWIEPVTFFDRDDFLDVARHRYDGGGDHLPFGIYFASDGSDGFYLVDTENALGEGQGAIFWTDRTLRAPLDCAFTAPTLAAMLEALAEHRFERPRLSLRRRAIEALKAALRAPGPEVEHGAPVDEELFLATGDRLGIFMPEELDRVLAWSDGFRVPARDLTVHAAAELMPVEGTVVDDTPGAVWFARDGQAQYAMTLRGFREPSGEMVVRVGPGEDVRTAPLVGPLASVLAQWITSGGES